MKNRKPALFLVLALLFVAAALAQSPSDSASAHRPVIYVMPNAIANPGTGDNSQVVVDSSHNGKEPQVAKIYQELQRQKECQGFAENIIKDKADYFLLLQHGGGKGNRWALSDKGGNVIASGDSLLLGNSVKDACLAIGKDRQMHGSSN
ncbi:MAG TPA: hypothetical protein VHW45_07130 [Candidatus Sulfotelmatobacter sp.]|jgi:hypothetical protein|nr:hypothetical protein [Candidatus Sulfotelmatobacter sp.]